MHTLMVSIIVLIGHLCLRAVYLGVDLRMVIKKTCVPN